MHAEITHHFIQRFKIRRHFLLLLLGLIDLLLVRAQLFPIVQRHFTVNLKLHFDYGRRLHAELGAASGDLENMCVIVMIYMIGSRIICMLRRNAHCNKDSRQF